MRAERMFTLHSQASDMSQLGKSSRIQVYFHSIPRMFTVHVGSPCVGSSRIGKVVLAMSSSNLNVARTSEQAFGDLLHTMREAHQPRLTRQQLADKAHCDPSTITRLERGERHPSRNMVASLTRALDLPVSDARRLMDAADIGPQALEAEVDHFCAAIAGDDRHDELLLHVFRTDLGAISAAWRELMQAMAWLRQGQHESARGICDRLYHRQDLTPAMHSAAGWYLAVALQRCGELGEADELLEYMQAVQESSPAATHPQSALFQARVASQRGDIAVRRGKYVLARAHYDRAHALYLVVRRRLPEEQAWLAHIGLGNAALLYAKLANFQGKPDEALRHCDEADQQWNHATCASHSTDATSQRREGMLRTKEFRAWALTRCGDFRQALLLRQQVGDEATRLHLIPLLLRNRLYLGDDLRRKIEQRVEVQQRLPHLRFVSPGAALDAIRDKDLDALIAAAENVYADALRLCGSPDAPLDPLVYGLCLRNMAVVKRMRHRFDEAEALLTQAAEHEHGIKQQVRMPPIYEVWGDLYWDMRRRKRAKQQYERALADLNDLLEPEDGDDLWRRQQLERLGVRLEGLRRGTRAPAKGSDDDDREAGLWLEWMQACRRLGEDDRRRSVCARDDATLDAGLAYRLDAGVGSVREAAW